MPGLFVGQANVTQLITRQLQQRSTGRAAMLKQSPNAQALRRIDAPHNILLPY
jgi:hypothetical protein